MRGSHGRVVHRSAAAPRGPEFAFRCDIRAKIGSGLYSRHSCFDPESWHNRLVGHHAGSILGPPRHCLLLSGCIRCGVLAGVQSTPRRRDRSEPSSLEATLGALAMRDPTSTVSMSTTSTATIHRAATHAPGRCVSGSMAPVAHGSTSLSLLPPLPNLARFLTRGWQPTLPPTRVTGPDSRRIVSNMPLGGPAVSTGENAVGSQVAIVHQSQRAGASPVQESTSSFELVLVEWWGRRVCVVRRNLGESRASYLASTVDEATSRQLFPCCRSRRQGPHSLRPNIELFHSTG